MLNVSVRDIRLFVEILLHVLTVVNCSGVHNYDLIIDSSLLSLNTKLLKALQVPNVLRIGQTAFQKFEVFSAGISVEKLFSQKTIFMASHPDILCSANCCLQYEIGHHLPAAAPLHV